MIHFKNLKDLFKTKKKLKDLSDTNVKLDLDMHLIYILINFSLLVPIDELFSYEC
jgi:hypothetical protein